MSFEYVIQICRPNTSKYFFFKFKIFSFSVLFQPSSNVKFKIYMITIWTQNHMKQDRIPCISNAELEAILTQKKILERDLVTFDDVCIFLRREMRRTIEGKSKVREMLREREEMMARLENFRESYEVRFNLCELLI